MLIKVKIFSSFLFKTTGQNKSFKVSCSVFCCYFDTKLVPKLFNTYE